MVIDSETDDTPHAIGPVIQRKAKTQQQQPQPVRQPPIQETYLMREYMLTELIDKIIKFQRKARRISRNG